MNHEVVVNALQGISCYKSRKQYVDINQIATDAIEYASKFNGSDEQAYQCVKYAMKRILND